MGLIVATTFALSVLIVLWSIDIKPLAGVLLSIAIILTAAGFRIGAAKLPGRDAS